jgi:outer membrane protein OmpA-like peptidoglycan-associated protein
MYLRRIQNPTEERVNEPGSAIGILVFTMVLLAVILITSLSDTETYYTRLLDSLNTADLIYFEFGSYELNSESYELLDKFAEEMKSDPLLKVQITGYTDDVGSEDFNLVLSLKRAQTVKEYLVQKGCSPENIQTSGKGKNEPLNDNLTASDKAKNRRVEFSFLNKTEEQEEKDITYINTTLKPLNRNEIKGELSVRDTTGEPIEGITEEDVSAMLKWEIEKQKDSVSGTVKFIPIDDKKKIAFTFTMDYSPSMYNDKFNSTAPKTEKILAMENAVKKFIDIMDQKNMAKIIKFGSVIDIVQSFTKSKDALRKAILAKCYPREGTALFKSIYTALCDATYESNPTVMKTVIAFTDGEENSSGRINKDSIYRLSEFKGVKVYTVGLLDEFKHSVPLGMNSIGEADLVEIAAKTGGFYWWASKTSDLPVIYESILNQILKSYQVSIIWNYEKLPPKGTKVTAVVRVNVKGRIRTVYKDYIME